MTIEFMGFDNFVARVNQKLRLHPSALRNATKMIVRFVDLFTRSSSDPQRPGGSSAATGQGSDDLLDEMRQRLINIEDKINSIMLADRTAPVAESFTPAHPDQPFGNRTYAQFGEDLIIINIFEMLGLSHPTYLDVGAHHPLDISNTALLHLRGSTGINIEANPNLIEAFRQHRPKDINLNVGIGPQRGSLQFHFIDDWSGRNTFSKEVAEDFIRQDPRFRIQKTESLPVVTLNDVIAEHAKGRFPDFLSLDVEGLDFEILSTTKFNDDRPLVICVEAVTGNGLDSGAQLVQLLRSRNYLPYVRTLGNLIFVHHSLASTLGIAMDSDPQASN